MHYHAELWMPGCCAWRDTPEGRTLLVQAITPIMAPFSEHTSRSYKTFFDYWIVGGRWTGEHDGYKPYEDTANMEVCDLCHGSGTRSDLVGSETNEYNRGCNGCSGTGLKIKWDLNPHPGDVMPLKDVREDLMCNTLIVAMPGTKRAKVFQTEVLNSRTKNFDKTAFGSYNSVKAWLRDQLDVRNGYLVTLDYHS